ncbi:MAG TPA: PilZ domain-containing protein [Xanthobacteraceae bacterium]|nr:PilZ domain-containing protein [Xanthobacteraceae bacterium]
MAEHRTHPRHRTLKAGKIVFNHRSCVVDCTIRNLSARGACLQVPSTVGIPDDFDLLIEPDRMAQACRVAWKDDRRMGVDFR